MSVSLSPTLRRVLLADAVVSGAAAILMAAGAWLIAPWLDLPVQLLFWAGVSLLPFVVLLALVALSTNTSRGLLISIIAVNGLWVVASFALLASGLVSPNLLGTAFVIAQAMAVAVFAVLQFAALRAAVAAPQQA